jgi:hypothetical protein
MIRLEEISLNQSVGYIFVRGRERIRNIAHQSDYPAFLLESAAIEDRNCRYFTRERQSRRIILIIDFDTLSDQQLRKLTYRSFWSSIPGFLLVDHINLNDFRYRLSRSIVGSPTSKCPPECLLEGSASDNAFPYYFNDINVVDPFLHLSDRFVVYEKGEIYQWQFATLGSSLQSPKHSAYLSKEVNLSEFDRIYHELITEQNKKEQDLLTLERLYNELALERRKILDYLKEVHLSRKRAYNKINTKGCPPRIGRFDYLRITNQGYEVSTNISPLLYRAALVHLSSVKKVTAATPYDERILLETIPGILLSYMCLDSHVNILGEDLKIPHWEDTIDSSLESRIGAITKSLAGTNLLKQRPDLKRTIDEFVSLRNDLIHYKQKFYPSIKLGKELVSEIYARIGPDSLLKILKNVRNTIKQLNIHIGMQVPLWLEKRPDWLEESDPDKLTK